MNDHIVKVVSPYGLGPYVAVAIGKASYAEWFLYDLHGKQLKCGRSEHSHQWDLIHQAMVNCMAVARRMVRKEMPVLFNKQPKFKVSGKEGKQLSMLGDR